MMSWCIVGWQLNPSWLQSNMQILSSKHKFSPCSNFNLPFNHSIIHKNHRLVSYIAKEMVRKERPCQNFDFYIYRRKILKLYSMKFKTSILRLLFISGYLLTVVYITLTIYFDLNLGSLKDGGEQTNGQGSQTSCLCSNMCRGYSSSANEDVICDFIRENTKLVNNG